MQWDDEDEQNPNGENDWSKSSLQTYLNNDYYGTIDSNVQAKIDSTYVWKLGGSSTYNDVTAQMFYERERGTEVYEGRPTEWTGSIGLMYPSDYGFATSGGSTTNRSGCLVKELFNWDSSDVSDCKNNNWLYSSSDQWTLVPTASLSYGVFAMYDRGFVYNDYARPSYAVSPTLYLLPTVEIVSGTGTSTDPFQLK